ncbi:MAG: hypothetical protein ACXVA2_24675 [Mucilaginibacter sp.]
MDSTQKETEVMVTEVWIPLRCYKLTLKHKLLNELGEISHFVLKALHQAPLTLADFELITGLSNQQLRPVFKRLEGLRFIDQQGQLTSSGQSIAYILESLHQQTVSFWLDRRYQSERKAILMVIGDSPLVNELPKEAIKIEPKRTERDWDIDCFYQIERLRKSTQDVLPWLFQAFEQLPNIETMKWGQEWELDLRVDKDFADGYGLSINLEVIHQNIKEPIISLYTRVLALETYFEFPQGIELSQFLECPKPLKFQYSFVEDEFYQDLPYVDGVNLDTTLECPSDPKDSDMAVKMLALCHEKSSESYSMFNRHHIFYKVWQQHDVSWLQVWKCLPKNDDDIYQTYIQGEQVEDY